MLMLRAFSTMVLFKSYHVSKIPNLTAIRLGQEVFAAPRAVVAMMRQCNMIDLTRRSPSYEYRLLKYRHRGYEVRYPQLRREDVRESVRTYYTICSPVTWSLSHPTLVAL